MTMHMLVGNGEMPKKELTATLNDLWEVAQAADEEFWFTIVAQEEPNATHSAVATWLSDNEIYYEVVVEDADNVDEIYGNAQKTHAAKRVTTKVINLLKAASEEEGADVLGLFVNLTEDDDDDTLLLDILQSAIDAGFKGYALNDSMTEIDLSEEDTAEEGEEEPEEEAPTAAAPSKKAAAVAKAAPKKAAGATKKATSVPTRLAEPEEEETDEAPLHPYTREELEELTDPEVRAIGNSLGIATRGRENWIEKILEAVNSEEIEGEEDEAEVPAAVAKVPASTNGASLTQANLTGATVIVVMPSSGVITLLPLTNEMADVIFAE